MSEGCVLGFLGLIVAASWVLTSICLAVNDATADRESPGLPSLFVVAVYMAVTLPLVAACGMAIYLK